MNGKPDDGLRAIFHSNLRGVHWVAIETGFTQKGVPDSNGASAGREFWVESKSVRSGYRPKIDSLQVSWHEHRIRMGGRTFIAVRRRVDRESVDDLYLFHGSSIRRLLVDGMSDAPHILHETGSPGRWGWERVRKALLSTSFSTTVFRT